MSSVFYVFQDTLKFLRFSEGGKIRPLGGCGVFGQRLLGVHIVLGQRLLKVCVVLKEYKIS